ncbi:hypothetical protein M2226_003342 [Bradyrhizobium elkanii]|nr:hypothetical protein [Bradyrhizobium elkanii]MCW2171345.1 hypothetical protein [Bradyrhizobium elkanii]
MGLVGILVALGLLIWLSFRGWSVLLLAPAAAIVAAAFAEEPLLAHWTQTFMGGAAQFIAQFFPIFLLGALFGKLMDDSGSVHAIAHFMSTKLGARRAILAVVLAGAVVTYRRGKPFRRLFRFGAYGTGNVSRREHPTSAHAGHHRSGHLYIHDVGNARNARDSKYDSDAVLRNHAVCRARIGHRRGGDHACIRALVAPPRRGIGTQDR